MTENERKTRIYEIKLEINKLNAQLKELKHDCKCYEHIINKNDCAVCDVCGEYFGWWCPESPDHVCDYNQKDGSYDEDNCRYCGDPEERK